MAAKGFRLCGRSCSINSKASKPREPQTTVSLKETCFIFSLFKFSEANELTKPRLVCWLGSWDATEFSSAGDLIEFVIQLLRETKTVFFNVKNIISCKNGHLHIQWYCCWYLCGIHTNRFYMHNLFVNLNMKQLQIDKKYIWHTKITTQITYKISLIDPYLFYFWIY